MIEQLVIAVLAPAAIWTSNDSRDALRRWGPVLGLISQPAWYIAAIDAGQWGVLAVCPIYTLAWARGALRDWRGGLWRLDVMPLTSFRRNP